MLNIIVKSFFCKTDWIKQNKIQKTLLIKKTIALDGMAQSTNYDNFMMPLNKILKI